MHVLVAGHNAGAAAKAAAQIAGVAKVLHADGEHLAHGLAENMAAQVLALAGDYSHILFPATACGKNIAPRVAAKLDVGQISDITKVDSRRHLRAPDLRRQRHRHRAEPGRHQGHHRAHHRLRRRPPPPAAAAAVETVAAVADSGKTQLRGQRDRQERPSRTDRRQDHRLRRPRAGQQPRSSTKCMTPLADKLGAALGASRAAVDAGYAPNDWQVGPDRQDRRAAAVHRRRHLGRDPAPGRHEGLAR